MLSRSQVVESSLLCGRGRVLLKDVRPSSRDFIHPGHDHSLIQHVDVAVDIESQALLEDVRLTTPRIITEVCILLCIITVIPEGSLQSFAVMDPHVLNEILLDGEKSYHPDRLTVLQFVQWDSDLGKSGSPSFSP